jgi:hypothetical protein
LRQGAGFSTFTNKNSLTIIIFFMNKYKSIVFLMALFFTCLLPVTGHAQNCDVTTRVQLKEKLEQMGFTVKTINEKAGEEKYEVTHPGAGFNVPVGYEISASTNFIWLTAFLGKADTANAEKNLKIVRENANIQPSFFYITPKGNLMMAVAVENRGVTPAILRRHIDKLVGDVSKTSDIWQ